MSTKIVAEGFITSIQGKGGGGGRGCLLKFILYPSLHPSVL